MRGLHLDTTGVTLRARLAAFGDVASCRVVMDKTTGRSKGVAFVDFVSPEGASKAVAASEVRSRGRGASASLYYQLIEWKRRWIMRGPTHCARVTCRGPRPGRVLP